MPRPSRFLRFSIQNSVVALRKDSDFVVTDVLGYLRGECTAVQPSSLDSPLPATPACFDDAEAFPDCSTPPRRAGSMASQNAVHCPIAGAV